jgi:hypothetical protein
MFEVLVTLAVIAVLVGLSYLGERLWGSQDALPPARRRR